MGPLGFRSLEDGLGSVEVAIRTVLQISAGLNRVLIQETAVLGDLQFGTVMLRCDRFQLPVKQLVADA